MPVRVPGKPITRRASLRAPAGRGRRPPQPGSFWTRLRAALFTERPPRRGDPNWVPAPPPPAMALPPIADEPDNLIEFAAAAERIRARRALADPDPAESNVE